MRLPSQSLHAIDRGILRMVLMMRHQDADVGTGVGSRLWGRVFTAKLTVVTCISLTHASGCAVIVQRI
jgi:hypothetical protein